MGYSTGTANGSDGPAFLALAAIFLTLLLVSLFLFGFACTVPPL